MPTKPEVNGPFLFSFTASRWRVKAQFYAAESKGLVVLVIASVLRAEREFQIHVFQKAIFSAKRVTEKSFVVPTLAILVDESDFK